MQKDDQGDCYIGQRNISKSKQRVRSKWSATAHTSETCKTALSIQLFIFLQWPAFNLIYYCTEPSLLSHPTSPQEANPAFERRKVTEIPQRYSSDSQTGAWKPSLQNRHRDRTWAVGQMNRSHRCWFNEVHCNAIRAWSSATRYRPGWTRPITNTQGRDAEKLRSTVFYRSRAT